MAGSVRRCWPTPPSDVRTPGTGACRDGHRRLGHRRRLLGRRRRWHATVARARAPRCARPWAATPSTTRPAAAAAVGRPGRAAEPLLGAVPSCVLEDGTELSGPTARSRPTCRSATTTSHPLDGGPGHPPDRHPRALPPARRPAQPGAGRPALRRAGPARAGASATSADLRAPRRLGRGRSAPACCAQPAARPPAARRSEPSPYFPSSRRWRNPLYLRIEDVPGADGVAELAPLGRRGPRARTTSAAIDRDAVWALKRRRSSALWARPRRRPAASTAGARDRAERSRPTPRFCALAEHHGAGWHGWPAEHRHPDRPGRGARSPPSTPTAVALPRVAPVAARRPAGGGRGAGAAARPTSPSASTPTAPTPGCWQDLLALGVPRRRPARRVQPSGQDWGLPPFVPWKLRAAGYEPLARAVARRPWATAAACASTTSWACSGCSGSRRAADRPTAPTCATGATSCSTCWPSRACGPAPSSSARTSAPSSPRCATALADGGLLSYRLAWFEDEPPEQYPRQALAAVTTHDLPTVAGVWTGDDVADQRAAGVDPTRPRANGCVAGSSALTGLGADAPVEEVIVAAHRRLAAAPAHGRPPRSRTPWPCGSGPTCPGTTDERPNWSTTLPVPLATSSPTRWSHGSSTPSTAEAPAGPTRGGRRSLRAGAGCGTRRRRRSGCRTRRRSSRRCPSSERGSGLSQ